MSSPDLSTIQIIVGIAVATIGIQLTLGGVISRVLWSHFNRFKDSYERQMGFMGENLTRAEARANRAEDRLDACMDDLDACRERVHQQNGGFRV